MHEQADGDRTGLKTASYGSFIAGLVEFFNGESGRTDALTESLDLSAAILADPTSAGLASLPSAEAYKVGVARGRQEVLEALKSFVITNSTDRVGLLTPEAARKTIKENDIDK